MLRCGVALRDITPAHPVALHGYGSRTELSDATCSEPIQISCLALEAADGTRLLLVSCDMAGIEEPVSHGLYALLESEIGISYPNIMLSCSHTHFAPGLQACRETADFADSQIPDSVFGERFRSALVEVAKESLTSMEPAVLEAARLAAPGAAFNRRWRRCDGSVAMNLQYPNEEQRHGLEEMPIDDELTLLRFRRQLRTATGSDGKGDLIGCLCNYGCHPVTGGRGEGGKDEFMSISSDYIYYLRETVEAEWQCPLLFTLGAAGDTVPMRRFQESRTQLGRLLGATAVLAEAAFNTVPEPVELAAEVRQVPANLREPVPPEQLHGRLWSSSDGKYNIRLQLLRIGNGISMVCLPFEVLSEFARTAKAADPSAVIVTCCGGYAARARSVSTCTFSLCDHQSDLMCHFYAQIRRLHAFGSRIPTGWVPGGGAQHVL